MPIENDRGVKKHSLTMNGSHISNSNSYVAKRHRTRLTEAAEDVGFPERTRYFPRFNSGLVE